MPKTDPFKLQQAVQFLGDFPDTPVAKVARKFDVDRSTLRARLAGRTPDRGGHNTKLSIAEEKALCRYIDGLDGVNLAVRSKFITEAANRLLAARSLSNDPSDAETVSHNWTTRFVQRHGYYCVLQKHAKRTAIRRREHKNRVLQAGGVLTQDDTLQIAMQKAEDEVAAAHRVLAREAEKQNKRWKQQANMAAKVARRWRLTGRLKPAEVNETGHTRLLRRC